MSIVLKLIALLVIANVIAWYQIQGQFMKGSIAQLLSKDWIVVVLGIPIGWMLWKSATLSYQYFGAVWNIRMIGFGLGTMIFGGGVYIIPAATYSLIMFATSLIFIYIIRKSN